MRHPHDIRILSQVRCHLGEGPSYDPRTGTAWWVDILEARLFEKPIASAQKALVHVLPVQVSDIAAIDGAHQLLSAEDGLYVRSIRDGDIRMLCPLEEDLHDNRSNDGRVHPSGALWIGTMDRDATKGRGSIYHVAGTKVHRLFGGLTIPNGISFSPDGATGYFVDTDVGVLHRVPLDPRTGLPRGPVEIHFDHRGGEGAIDGAAVDAEGLIWTARFGAGCLDAYSPAGERVRTVSVPMRQPTCPTFAGRDLDRLLVTSAYEGMDVADRAEDPEHGRTILIDVGARGLLEPAFRLCA